MATWLSGISRQHRTIRHNAFLWCGIYLALFAIMILRLFWLQGVKGTEYRRIADRYHTRTTVLPAARGRLLDRNLAVLALDNQTWTLFADPALVRYPRFVAQQLAPVLGQEEAEVYAALTRRLHFVWVNRNLTGDVAEEVRNLHLPGVTVKEDGARIRIGYLAQPEPPDMDMARQLAEVLKLPVAEVKAALGLVRGDGPASGEKRWLNGTWRESRWDDVAALHCPGLIFTPAGRNYAMGVDPREYMRPMPRVPAIQAAQALAPLLGMTPEEIERRLRFRPRYSPLKLMLPEEEYREIMRLQSTIYVVSPGKVLDARGSSEEVMEDFSTAVDRLYGILNEKGKPETISRETIRARLSPGGARGALGVRMFKGRPSNEVANLLSSRPIPGVIYGLPGVGVQLQQRRYYPYGTLASPILGFVNDEKEGVFGIEQSQEDTLKGIDGRETVEIDSHHRAIPDRMHEHIAPIDGRDVVLTLDLGIQQVAEAELAKAVQEHRALRGECIVMDCNTGEILAMASNPAWDANTPGKSRVPLANPAISNYYEPGSTFKTVTVMAALEEGLIHDGEQVTYCSGSLSVGRGKPIGEAHNAHGTVDCGRLLEQSCNIGAATLALRLGSARFIKWCKALGFGTPTGLELANESSGDINERNVDGRIYLARMGFGQSLAVTPPQMAAAYSVAANGGEWVQAHLVKSRVQADGTVDTFNAPRRRVCSEATSRLLCEYLERVVTVGTGKSSAIPGYRVGGKTGTAQKAGPGGYGGGKAIGSFIAVMPVDKPRLTIICVIDEPQGSHYGGVVAAPVVREVGRRALQYLGVPPSGAEEEPDSLPTSP